MSTITCGNCKSQHESVDAVKACYNNVGRATVETEAAITQKQLEFIRKLMGEKDLKNMDVPADLEKVSKTGASALIKVLLGQPPKPKEALDSRVAVTEGMYKVGDTVYKVQAAVNGSGHLYAKMLRGKAFVYSPGAIRLLKPEDKMTLEQAKEWGLLYGTCCVCGRTLTDEISIANGIGPVCANKGWW